MPTRGNPSERVIHLLNCVAGRYTMFDNCTIIFMMLLNLPVGHITSAYLHESVCTYESVILSKAKSRFNIFEFSKIDLELQIRGGADISHSLTSHDNEYYYSK